MRHAPRSAQFAALLVLTAAGCGARPQTNNAIDARIEAAHAHATHGRAAEAVEEAQRLVEMAPDRPESHDTLGEMLLLAGRLAEARRSFEAALARAPAFATAHHGLAMVALHDGDEPSAIAALTRGLALTRAPDPTYVRTRLLEALAAIHWQAGRDDAALAALADSVAAQGLPPGIAERVTRVGRARMWLERARWQDALTELAAVRAPGGPPPLEVVARGLEAAAHAGAGALPEAEAALTELRGKVSHDDPGLLAASFAVAMARGDLAAAGDACARLYELDAFAGERTELALALALRDAGRGDEARGRLDRIGARYLRSAPSAHVRRTAASTR